MSRRKAVEYCLSTFLAKCGDLTFNLNDFTLVESNRRQFEFGLFSWTLIVLDAHLQQLNCSDWITVKRTYARIIEYISLFDGHFENFFKSLESFKQALITNTDEIFHICSIPWIVRGLPKQSINDICTYLKNITLSNPDLIDKEIDEWIANEERLEQVLQTLNFEDPELQAMQQVVTYLLKDLSFSELIPTHGSGSIAEDGFEVLPSKSTKFTKWNFVEIDRKIRLALDLSGLREFQPTPLVGYEDTHSCARLSRLAYVPKTYKRLRGVNPMPANLIFWQLGVKRCCYKYAAQHPILKHCAVFADQSVNRRGAQEGSKASLQSEIYAVPKKLHRKGCEWFYDSSSTRRQFTKRKATIDLSAASDSVLWELVKFLFHDTPLYPFLLALRSDEVALPGDRGHRKMLKSSPMGDGLCFFVETIVFLAINIIGSFGTDFSDPEIFSDIIASCRVYGDDIECLDSAYYSVCQLLTKCGFIPNMDKSFHGTNPFRESCGIECFTGIDISPIRYSRKQEGVNIRYLCRLRSQNDPRWTLRKEFSDCYYRPIKLKPTQFMCFVDKCNQAYMRGYTHLRFLYLSIIQNAYYTESSHKRGQKKTLYHRVKPLITSRIEATYNSVMQINDYLWVAGALYMPCFSKACALRDAVYNPDYQNAWISATSVVAKEVSRTELGPNYRFQDYDSTNYFNSTVGLYDSLVQLELRDQGSRNQPQEIGFSPSITNPEFCLIQVCTDALI